MVTDHDLELLMSETNYRWGANVSKYDVQEVLEYGSAWNLEPYEVEAIRQEARANGIY